MKRRILDRSENKLYQYIEENGLNEKFSNANPDGHSLIKLLPIDTQRNLYINIVKIYMSLQAQSFKNEDDLEKQLPSIPYEVVELILYKEIEDAVQENKSLLKIKINKKILELETQIKFNNLEKDKEELEKYENIVKNFNLKISFNELEIDLIELLSKEEFYDEEIEDIIKRSNKKIEHLDSLLIVFFQKKFLTYLELEHVIEDKNNSIKILINGSSNTIKDLDCILIELLKTEYLEAEQITNIINASEKKIIYSSTLYKKLQKEYPEQAKMVSLIEKSNSTRNSNMEIMSVDYELIQLFKNKFDYLNIEKIINASGKKINNLQHILIRLFNTQRFTHAEIRSLIKGSKTKYFDLDFILMQLFQTKHFGYSEIKALLDESKGNIKNIDNVLMRYFKIKHFQDYSIEDLINASEGNIQNLDKILIKFFKTGCAIYCSASTLINKSDGKIQDLDEVLKALLYAERHYPFEYYYNLEDIISISKKIIHNKDLYEKLQEEYPEQAKMVSFCPDVNINVNDFQSLDEKKLTISQ